MNNKWKNPSITTVNSVLNSVNHVATQINGKWVPARSIGFFGIINRLRCAWLVFTGRADALVWPEGQ